MTNSIQAIPTEYKGIRFRSKSEAVFARALDLMEAGLWEYEPEFEDWRPDFLVANKKLIKGKKKIVLFIIEYKPAIPTETYLSELWPKMDRAISRIQQAACNCAGLVYCGSPFTVPCISAGTVFACSRDGEKWRRGETDSVFCKFQEALTYRFDLQHL